MMRRMKRMRGNKEKNGKSERRMGRIIKMREKDGKNGREECEEKKEI